MCQVDASVSLVWSKQNKKYDRIATAVERVGHHPCHGLPLSVGAVMQLVSHQPAVTSLLTVAVGHLQ